MPANTMTLPNQTSTKHGDIPVRSLIRKELLLRRRPLAYASLAVIAVVCLHTSFNRLVSAISAKEWFATKTTDGTSNLMKHKGVAATIIARTRGEESTLFFTSNSIPLDFQGQTTLNEQILSASSLDIDQRFFSADGAGSGHRDCRFSDDSPPPSWPHVNAYMVNMFRAWSRFAIQYQIQYFVLHGTLLGWHWNQSIMDFDDDIDIGMTLGVMDTVLKPLNGTVFEGQYLVEINTFYAKRKRGADNAIDAEFIDIQGGFKIDITAFSSSFPLSNARVRIKNTSIRAADSHTYKLDDIFPLQPTHLNGAPTFIPNQAKKLVTGEYSPDSVVKNTFKQYRFNGSRWVRGRPDPQATNKCRSLEPHELYTNASALFIPWQKRKELALQTSMNYTLLNAQMESQLRQVDVDNTISAMSLHELQDQTLHVAEFNIQRGKNWCKAANLIRANKVTREAQIIFVNEADWGMSRSGNAHTGRLLAQELGMNYAWGIEFLELTPGDGNETRKANQAVDCPVERRGLGWPGSKQDALGYTGNLILSKWPLTNVRIVRFPVINRLFPSKQGDEITAGGTEKRLGGRMALYASIEHVPGYAGPIHLGCFHLQTVSDNRFPEDWKTLRKETMRLMKKEQDEVIDPTLAAPFLIGGGGWKSKWCEEKVGFTNLHPYVGGDWICGRNVKEVSDFTSIKAQGIADHDLFGVKVRL